MMNTNVQIQTSWDDGSFEDLRIADLLRKYSLPGVFFIANVTNELSEEDIRELAKEFDVGGHTLTHPEDMKRLSASEQFNEIYGNKHWLQNIVGREVEHFCYPGGKFNETTVNQVKRAGFSSARTTNILNTVIPIDQFRVCATIHVKPDRKEYKGNYWLDIAKEKYIEAEQNSGYFHVWGHGYEVDSFQMWEQLEELFKFIYERNYHK